jgi:hypothetical protein
MSPLSLSTFPGGLSERVPSRRGRLVRSFKMRRIHIEIVYQGAHCPASFYMDQAVEEVLPLYGEQIQYTKIEYNKSKEHSNRFLELSIAVFGEKAVRRGLQLAPIPSLFINGKLIFANIPIKDELESAIEAFLGGREYES